MFLRCDLTSTFASRQFGLIEYTPDAVVEFPEGIPAFEQETRFVLIERPESAPLIYLQSLSNADLSFATLPAKCVDADYRLQLTEEDFAFLGSPEVREEEVLCLVILTVTDKDMPTVNLKAPVVIQRRTRRARQVIQFESGYSFRHPLPVAVEEGVQPC